MAFKKTAIFPSQSMRALNRPQGWDIINLPDQIKTASIKDDENLGGFDLKQATKDHPDHLYIKIFAIRKDEPNDNGDAFSARELKSAVDTFVGVPLFTNHQNDDVEKARGECVHSWYDSENGGIFIIGRVDKVAYPRLARGIEEGYITGSSMGCSVEYSICSICHNKAHTSDEYCGHVKNGKNRKLTMTIPCAYHESSVDDKDDKCPLCGSTKDNINKLSHDAQQVFEHNYGLRFIENSFVVNPACHDCGVKCILHVPKIQQKVADCINSINSLIKNSSQPEFFEENAENLAKLGGVKELESLKNSMSEMEQVVKSMLKQKENVSMEYVSDIVKAMSDVQVIFDELVEMGYAALPSPKVMAEVESPISTEQFPESVQPPQQMPTPQSSGVQTSDLGGLGNVTLPKKSSKNIKDFLKIKQSISSKVSSLTENIQNFKNNRVNNNNLEIGAKMATENTNTKTAAGAENLEVITEKQLGKKQETLHPRTEAVYEGITESKEQIGGEEQSNDTTSDSPQVRLGTYETITENQLKTESVLGSAIVNFKDYPDVITEKQWDDFSRDISGDLPDDYTDSITQAQIRDLLSKHKFVGAYETITEDQLRSINMTDGLKRWANKDYTVSLIKTATKIVADMISEYRKSPEEIAKIASLINDDNTTKLKVAFLTIVNSLPRKTDDRESFASNARYFGKQASTSAVSTVDALIMSVAENAQFNMKAEDVLDSVHHVINSKTAMVKVNIIVKKSEMNIEDQKVITKASAFDSALKELDKPKDGLYKIKATLEDIGSPMTDKVAFVDSVKKFAQEMIDDDSVAAAVIKVEVGSNGELVIDVQDGADEEIGPDDIGDVIENEVEDIDAGINGQFEETDDCRGKEVSQQEVSPQEEPRLAAAKKEIKKTAQMMGGEMGGQGGMGQGAGAGASLPAAPAAEAPPMENLTNEDPLADEEGDMDNLKPLPPGSICPVCGSDDVDIVAGKGKCNNCGSEMTYKVEVNVTRWQGVTPSDEESEVPEEGFEGEGFEMPEEKGMGMEVGGGENAGVEMPAVAAYTKLNPKSIRKIAEAKIELGSVSPATGKTNTVKLANGERMCLDTGTRYKITYITSKDGKNVYGQWQWTPKVAGTDCPSCVRAKQKFVKALSSIDMTEDNFDKLDIKEKVATIIKLKEAGALKPVKLAGKDSSITQEYKLAYGDYGDNFPTELCIEKLARRFGENAVCLSGPDEGKSLAKSVCERLRKADVYTDRIAIKVANNWCDTDGDEECITYQVRSGYSLREAAVVCEHLKVAVAQAEDMFADELNVVDEPPIDEDPLDDGSVNDDMDDVDPFDNIDDDIDNNGGTVSLELPMELVEELDAQLDVALGENPAEEDHDEVPTDVTVGDEETPIEEVSPEEGIIEEVSPDELDETSECTQFEDGTSEFPENKEGVPNETSKVTITVNGEPVGGEMKPSDEEEPDVMDDTLAEQIIDIKEARNMSGGLGQVGKPQMDLSSVIEIVRKQADGNIEQQNAQDSPDIGSYTAGEEGSKMGHESETIPSSGKPSVPRDNATMGQESSDLNPQDKPQPTIPQGDATMGHEKEVGLDGGDSRYTGGDKGQGKTELASTDDDLYHMKGFGSSKKSLSNLAEKIAKELAPKEPVAKDPDIQPIKDKGTIGKEEKFDAKEINESELKSDSGFLGHEKETLDNKPDSPKDHPDVNTGDAKIGEEKLDSEKTTKDKGTVIASSETKTEAYRVAARMLQANKIEASELETKIGELKSYKPQQIRDIEKSIFASVKGLDAVSDGMSQPVQINETSSVRNSGDELSKKLSSMFTLGKQNIIADNDSNTQLRKTYHK